MKMTCRKFAGVLTMLLLVVAGAVSAQTTIYPSVPLTSGQTVSGSVGLNSWKNYKITASSSHTQLKVDMTNLSADVDLYVRKDYSPTLTAYTCRPYKTGTTAENCTISISGAATWYISVQGYKAGSFNIKATLSGGTTIYPADPLTSGQTVSGSVGLNSWKNYKITSSSSHTQLKVDMTNLSADVDLYVRKDSSPTLSAYTCRPYKGGTTAENCTISISGAATWYISVYGFVAGSYNLKATLSSSITKGQAIVNAATASIGQSSGLTTYCYDPAYYNNMFVTAINTYVNNRSRDDQTRRNTVYATLSIFNSVNKEKIYNRIASVNPQQGTTNNCQAQQLLGVRKQCKEWVDSIARSNGGTVVSYSAASTAPLLSSQNARAGKGAYRTDKSHAAIIISVNRDGNGNVSSVDIAETNFATAWHHPTGQIPWQRTVTRRTIPVGSFGSWRIVDIDR